ncbi:glycyl-radical enzyme activating protein [Geminisphaera colitermitum]|uniref:glycyl-radical enzyme activating protein n=1 Tax=Geminisphaera colitermitum TaxID=1148786 RepID=UPI000158CC9E|nr:glycyl-radical enzyme activating protein [Geminisphaera colitermitum]
MPAAHVITGIITDIQRFALHDGPGIRTTVFCKGCNMRCAWCHNPETINPRPELQFFRSRCIGCGHCLAAPDTSGAGASADAALCFTDDTGVARHYRGDCHAEALVKVGREVAPQDVLAEALQDKNFYANSGGGVTLSGGEVTVQTHFALETLALLKASGIHTAIETNLAVPWEQLESLLPLLDLVMFDIKHMDSVTHREWTGVANERILENARHLGALDLPLVVRTPVIPDFNDNANAIEAIAMFAATLPALDYYELLAYNPLGSDKYRCMGKPYLLKDAPMISEAAMGRFRAVAAKHGIKVRIA